jgi:hypothetical protein
MTRITEWFLGIFGVIVASMGVVILTAGADQYVGLGGDLLWQVGEIAPAWGYGLLIGGAVLLVGAVLLLLMERRHPGVYNEPSERAVLLTHIAVFVLVNGILWTQDIVAGGGLEYAYWATIPWGLGLVAHITAYLVGRRQTGHTGTPHPAA